jgi:hypothetical protein
MKESFLFIDEREREHSLEDKLMASNEGIKVT